MKPFLIAGALAASLTGASAFDGTQPAGEPERATITTLVASIPLAVDRAAYDLAEAAFAPEIVIDYTSLWGGEPQTTTPAALMDAWRGIVPGFTATWHELGPVEVTIDGESATATAPVDGRHWIDELARQDGEWRVTRMVFDLTNEIGDRTLATEAMERAAR